MVIDFLHCSGIYYICVCVCVIWQVESVKTCLQKPQLPKGNVLAHLLALFTLLESVFLHFNH